MTYTHIVVFASLETASRRHRCCLHLHGKILVYTQINFLWWRILEICIDIIML